LQHIILKFVLFISSVLTVNATLSLIINSDTQQVEYVKYKQVTLSLNLEKTSNQTLSHNKNNRGQIKGVGDT
jgi:hypothetical protein